MSGEILKRPLLEVAKIKTGMPEFQRARLREKAGLFVPGKKEEKKMETKENTTAAAAASTTTAATPKERIPVDPRGLDLSLAVSRMATLEHTLIEFVRAEDRRAEMQAARDAAEVARRAREEQLPRKLLVSAAHVGVFALMGLGIASLVALITDPPAAKELPNT